MGLGEGVDLPMSLLGWVLWMELHAWDRGLFLDQVLSSSERGLLLRVLPIGREQMSFVASCRYLGQILL